MSGEGVIVRKALPQPRHQLGNLLIRVGAERTTPVLLQREVGNGAGGSASRPEVYPFGMDLVQRAEYLRHLEGAVVVQQHRAGPQATGRGAGCDRRDQDLGSTSSNGG